MESRLDLNSVSAQDELRLSCFHLPNAVCAAGISCVC